jgi:actin-related protein
MKTRLLGCLLGFSCFVVNGSVCTVHVSGTVYAGENRVLAVVALAADDTETKLKAIEMQLMATAEQLKTTQNELATTKTELATTKSELATTKAELATAKAKQEAAEAKQKVAENNQKEAEKKQDAAEKARQAAEGDRQKAIAGQQTAEANQKKAEEKQKEAEDASKVRDAVIRQKDAEIKQRDAELKLKELEATTKKSASASGAGAGTVMNVSNSMQSGSSGPRVLLNVTPTGPNSAGPSLFVDEGTIKAADKDKLTVTPGSEGSVPQEYKGSIVVKPSDLKASRQWLFDKWIQTDKTLRTAQGERDRALADLDKAKEATAAAHRALLEAEDVLSKAYARRHEDKHQHDVYYNAKAGRNSAVQNYRQCVTAQIRAESRADYSRDQIGKLQREVDRLQAAYRAAPDTNARPAVGTTPFQPRIRPVRRALGLSANDEVNSESVSNETPQPRQIAAAGDGRTDERSEATLPDGSVPQMAVYRFVQPCTFPVGRYAPNWCPTGNEAGLTIFEGMEIQFFDDGNYQVRFNVAAPPMPALVNLSFQLQSPDPLKESIREHLMTLPPVLIKPRMVDGEASLEPQEIEAAGFSPLIAHRFDELRQLAMTEGGRVDPCTADMPYLARWGTARIGSGVVK